VFVDSFPHAMFKGKPKNKYYSQVLWLEAQSQETDASIQAWRTIFTSDCGMVSTRTSTDAIALKGDNLYDQVQQQQTDLSAQET
jgi:hypothetical protein